jgi:hypothetical protein
MKHRKQMHLRTMEAYLYKLMVGSTANMTKGAAV